jgi:peptidylprolyl isomerase
MRSRSIALGLFIFAFITIVAGVFYRAAKVSQDLPPAAEAPTTASLSTPAAPGGSMPSPGPSTGAEPLAQAQASTTQASVTPVRTLDLTPDAQGASRFSILLKTSKGPIRIKVFPKAAPRTVERFLELVQTGFYKGHKFHRVVPDFLIQTGDPQGTGMGGSGVKLRAELSILRHGAGAVGMARGSDPHSADSQFYITLSPQPQLDQSYTLFGQVTEGLDVARRIEKTDTLEEALIVE